MLAGVGRGGDLVCRRLGGGGIRTWRAVKVLRVRSIIFEKCCLCATLLVYLACKI